MTSFTTATEGKYFLITNTSNKVQAFALSIADARRLAANGIAHLRYQVLAADEKQAVDAELATHAVVAGQNLLEGLI